MKLSAPILASLISFCAPGQALKFAAESEASPVDQVVSLLTELKTNIEADGKTEQASYDKYACWCEDTLAKKAGDITTAKETIEDLQNRIVKLRGELGVHGAEIKQFEKDIAANEASQKEATIIRDKEAAGYHDEKSESEQCIGALEAAIGVLGGAPKKGFLETMQQAQLLSVVAGVRMVMGRPGADKTVGEKELEMVREFVANPAEFVGKGHTSLSAAQVAKKSPYGDYAPQSTQIQGILKGMYDSFAKGLERANTEEAERQKGFEELMVTKKEELTTLKESLGGHTTDKATKGKTLSDSRVELDDTKTQLEADETFFAQTKKSCSGRAGEWAQRSRMRAEELTGLGQAVEILTSEDAKKAFGNGSSTFLQLGNVIASSGKGRNVAYDTLKQLAGQYNNVRIAELAVRVKAGGHFDKILATIDNMIQHLREEETQDIEERDWCESKQGKNSNDLEDLNSDITKANQTMDRLKDEVTSLETKLKAVEADINTTQTTVDDLKNMRIEEHAEFVQGVKDDTKAIELLEKAIRHLSRFYEKKPAASLAQQGRADPPPEVSWKGDYNKREGEGKGAVAILHLIKEDLGREIKTGRQEDSDAQVNYESDRKAAMDTLRAQSKSKVELEKAKADLGLKISDLEGFRSQRSDDLSAEGEKKASLEKNCAWVESHFGTRRDSRKKEIAGLIDAKNYLAGVDSD